MITGATFPVKKRQFYSNPKINENESKLTSFQCIILYTETIENTANWRDVSSKFFNSQQM